MQSIKNAAANVLEFKIDPEWFVFITQPLDHLTLQHIDVSTWVKVSLDLKFKILVSSSSFSDFLNGQPEESLKRQTETLKIIPDCVVCKPVEVAPQPFFHFNLPNSSHFSQISSFLVKRHFSLKAKLWNSIVTSLIEALFKDVAK